MRGRNLEAPPDEHYAKLVNEDLLDRQIIFVVNIDFLDALRVVPDVLQNPDEAEYNARRRLDKTDIRPGRDTEMSILEEFYAQLRLLQNSIDRVTNDQWVALRTESLGRWVDNLNLETLFPANDTTDELFDILGEMSNAFDVCEIAFIQSVKIAGVQLYMEIESKLRAVGIIQVSGEIPRFEDMEASLPGLEEQIVESTITNRRHIKRLRAAHRSNLQLHGYSGVAWIEQRYQPSGDQARHIDTKLKELRDMIVDDLEEGLLLPIIRFKEG